MWFPMLVIIVAYNVALIHIHRMYQERTKRVNSKKVSLVIPLMFAILVLLIAHTWFGAWKPLEATAPAKTATKLLTNLADF